MSNEKRKRERLPLTQVLELRVGDGPAVTAQGINISESGILCRAEKEIAPGAGVNFYLTIPGAKSDMKVACEGVVLKCVNNNNKFDIVIDLTDQDCF